jgi:hypothetical protein
MTDRVQKQLPGSLQIFGHGPTLWLSFYSSVRISGPNRPAEKQEIPCPTERLVARI